MKQKKILALLLALILTASVLTGCGASSDSAAMNRVEAPAMPEAAPMEEMKGAMMDNALYSSAGSAGGETVQTQQKLIRRVSIDAETEDLDALVGNLAAKIKELGGYIENQQFYNGSAYASKQYRNANLTIRIPADKLDGFISQMKDVSNVVSYNDSQEDITLTYVSTESRIRALETEQERLLELLAKAENMNDLLKIEDKLTDVRYELEKYTSQLRVMANKVDYATVNLYINQVTVFTEVEEQNVWQRIGSGFRKNLKGIGENLQDFFVWFVVYSPQLVLWALIAAVAVVVIRKRAAKSGKKSRKQGSEKPEENQ